ncbi:MAG: hypothetical protein ABSF22_04900 [Bryobacteraceae bacterium]
MPGFLDSSYGVSDARRERRNKRVVLWTLAVLIVGGILFFTFRSWRQERVIKQFFSLLKQQNYQDAYKLWGCTQETPCKYYPPDRFNEDWGPAGQYKDVANAKIDAEDVCGSGVVFSVSIPKVDPFGLWVETATNTLSYAPWVRCPGRHLQLWEYLKSRFS